MRSFTDLQQAVINGNKTEILKILQVDFDLNKGIDVKGDTLLHLAFRNEESSQEQLIEILNIFLDRGVDINTKNKAGKTILHLAVERRMRDVIDLCLQRNANTNPKHKRWNSIAHFAVEEECRKLNSLGRFTKITESLENESSSFVDWMVSRGIDFFYKKNIQEYSPLYLANDLNLQHILLTLLKRIDDLPAAEKDQDPLICAYLDKNGDKYPYYNPTILNVFHPGCYNSRHVYDIVKIILEKNNRIDDESLDKALRTAINNKEGTNVIELLVQRIRNVNLHKEYVTPLVQTFADSFSGDSTKMKILRSLILKGANVNERKYNGETVALKLFCQHPTMEMLKTLKEAGADFSEVSSSGSNFLHLISQHGNEAGMINFIMNEGRLDLNKIDASGRTPLVMAIKCKNEFVAVELMEHGAKINNRDNSLLETVCAMGQVQVLEKLIEQGVSLDYRDKNDKTLLHFAFDQPKVVDLLIKNGLDVNATDITGKTPLHFATADVVQILFRSGAQVSAVDKDGNTPLYDALYRRRCWPENIDQLLKYGADMRDKKILVPALKRFEDPYTIDVTLKLRYLKRHLIKMKAAGLLDELPFAPIGINMELQNFFKQCQAEVELLKGISVDDSTSLYTLLHIKRDRRCAYVDNEKLKNFMEDAANEKKFRHYFVLIQGCYNEATSRKPLLESTTDIFNKLHGIHLPDLCADKIFMHLSNMDMVRFTEAFKNVTIDDSPSSLTNINC